MPRVAGDELALAPPGVVDERIEPTPGIDRGGDHPLAGAGEGQVVDRQLDGAGSEVDRLPGHALGLFAVDVGEHDPAALTGEGVGDRPSDVRCPTRDDDAAVG